VHQKGSKANGCAKRVADEGVIGLVCVEEDVVDIGFQILLNERVDVKIPVSVVVIIVPRA